MKKFSRMTALLMALVTVFSLTACGSKDDGPSGESADKPVTIIANTSYAADNMHVQYMQKFADMVNEKTNGTVTINIEAGGALGIGSYDVLRAVKNNEVPMSEFVITGVEGDEKIMGIYGLPFLCQDYDQAQTIWELSIPYVEKVASEKWNQKILYAGPWPFTCLWSQKKVDSVADMKGLKTRAFDTNNALICEATGGTPYALPFSEVYSSLATNLIDSVLTSTQSAVDGKFWEVLDYYQPISMGLNLSAITISNDMWNRLSTNQQQVMEECAQLIEDEIWDNIETVDATQAKVCTDNGITENPPSDEFKADLAAIAQDIHIDWLKGANDPDILALYNAYQEAVGGEAVDLG